MTMAVCAPAATILVIARPVLMLAGISNHLSARTAAVQRGAASTPPSRNTAPATDSNRSPRIFGASAARSSLWVWSY